MKSFRKITSLALAFAMIITSMATTFSLAAAINFEDVTETTAYSQAIYNLVEEGIINGYDEDGKKLFKPDATITRAEFSKVLSIAKEGSNAVFGQTTVNFPDMVGSEWAIPYVAHASGAGIVKGYEDGTFGPKNPVTYAEAVTMIVRALGYEPVVDKTLTPWYEGYIKMANQIGVTKEAGGIPDKGAPRGLVAQLCDNMLGCKKLVQTGFDEQGNPKYEISDKDIMIGEDDEEDEGVVTAIFGNSLRGSDDTLTKSQIKIENEIFTLSEDLKAKDLTDYLGKRVKYTYTGSSKYTVTSLKYAGGSSDLVITQEQLHNADLSEIKYFENPGRDTKTQTASLDSNLYVVYNGVGVPKASITAAFATTYMNGIETGDITLSNNDKDSAYDIAYINNYKTYFVNAPSTTDGVMSIYDKFGFEPKIDLDEDDVTVTKVTTAGGSASSAALSSIYTKNVVSIAVPLTQTYGTKVVNSTATISGEVTSMTDDYEYVEIGEKEYSVSPYFKRLIQTDATTYGFSIGDNVKAYLDFQGRIVCTEVSETTDPYGYLVDLDTSSGMDNKVWLKIFTDQGKWLKIKVADKVRVDGTSKSADYLVSYLQSSAGIINANKSATYTTNADYAQVIKYRKGTSNGETVLTDIYTVAGTAESSIKPYAFSAKNGVPKAAYTDCTASLKYSSSGNTLSDDIGTTQFTVNASTITFAVPSDRSKENDYRARKMSSQYYDKNTYILEPYEVATGSTSAKVVVNYLSAGATTKATVKVATPVYIITDIRGAQNEEGVTCHKVTFRELGKTEDVGPYYTENSTIMTGFAEGDLVKFARTGTDIEDIKLVYSFGTNKLYEKDGTTVATSNEAKWEYDGKPDYYHAITGTVWAFEPDGDAGKGALHVVPDFVVDNGDGTYTSVSDNFQSFALTDSTPYYQINDKGEIAEKTHGELIGALNNTYPETASKIVMIVLNKVVKGIFYLK